MNLRIRSKFLPTNWTEQRTLIREKRKAFVPPTLSLPDVFCRKNLLNRTRDNWRNPTWSTFDRLTNQSIFSSLSAIPGKCFPLLGNRSRIKRIRTLRCFQFAFSSSHDLFPVVSRRNLFLRVTWSDNYVQRIFTAMRRV